MSAQAGQYNGTKIKSGEQRRFREGAASVGANSIRGGMFMKRLASGTFLEPRKPRGSSRSTSHPFKVKAFQEGSTWKFRVEPGTFNGTSPKLDGVPINAEDPPSATLGSGEQHIYIKAKYTLTAANGFVHAVTLTHVTIEVKSIEETAPYGPNTTGEFYILLATFHDRNKTGQPIVNSLSAEVCGTTDGTGKARMITTGV